MTREEWLKRITAFTEGTAGVAEGITVSFEDFKTYILPAAAGGNTYAGAIAHAILKWSRMMVHAEPKKRAVCMTCDAEFWFSPASSTMHTPKAFHVMLPFAKEPALAIVTGICVKCFAREDLDKGIVQALREMWPDLHHIVGGSG